MHGNRNVKKKKTSPKQIRKSESFHSFLFSRFSFRCAVINSGQLVITNIKLMNEGLWNITLAFWALSENCEKPVLESSRLSVCPSAWNKSAPTGRIFTKFDMWVLFENMPEKFKIHENLTRRTGTFHEDLRAVMIPRSLLFRMRNVLDKNCTENQNTFYIPFIFSPRKSGLLWDNVEKYGRSGRATDDKSAHDHCMLDTQGYRHTPRICNTYCFSTATMVARTRLNVTLYLYCLSCYKTNISQPESC